MVVVAPTLLQDSAEPLGIGLGQDGGEVADGLVAGEEGRGQVQMVSEDRLLEPVGVRAEEGFGGGPVGGLGPLN